MLFPERTMKLMIVILLALAPIITICGSYSRNPQVITRQPLTTNYTKTFVLRTDTKSHANSETSDNEAEPCDESGILEQASSVYSPTETFALIIRSMYLFFIFSPVILTSGIAYMSVWFRRTLWFHLIGLAITYSGAAFIKWGQWASTRPDMFPESLCDLLSSLQADAPRHSFAYTRWIVQQQLGEPLESIFSYFPTDPVASGSIAQVYQAAYQGEWVAVKVRHPGVERQIKLDFIIMKSLASLLERSTGMNWIRLSESLAQFSHTISAQTRLDIEGYHLKQFNRNFRFWNDVNFPRPLVLTQAVLIESWEWGQGVRPFVKEYNDKIRTFSTLKKEVSSSPSNSNSGRPSGGLERKATQIVESNQSTTYDNTVGSNNPNPHAYARLVSEADLRSAHFLVTRGEDMYLSMLFRDNLVHADLHPGNMIIQQRHLQTQAIQSIPRAQSGGNTFSLTNNSQEELRQFKLQLQHMTRQREANRLVLVDAGMVARLSHREQSNFIGLLESIGEGDAVGATFCLLDWSKQGRSSYTEVVKLLFQEDMKVLFSKVAKGYGTNMDVGVILRSILGLLRVHQVSMDPNYATLVMNVLCLDSMAHMLLPSYNVMDAARPLLQFHRRVSQSHLGSNGIFRFLTRKTLTAMLWLKRRADKKLLGELLAARLPPLEGKYVAAL